MKISASQLVNASGDLVFSAVRNTSHTRHFLLTRGVGEQDAWWRPVTAEVWDAWKQLEMSPAPSWVERL